MPDDQNQNGHFEPIHEAHAIEQVLFALQIDRPLDDAAFSEVRKVAEQFQSELPGHAEIQGITLAIGAPGPTPQDALAGSVFRKVRPDGTIESELRVDRLSVTFRTTLYTRWDAVWIRARKYFDAVIPKYVSQASISGIGLNFVDKFAWSGKPTECRPDSLLRKGSKYICPHIYLAQDLWHSHTGIFLRVDDATKRLLNINIDCVDENRPNGSRRVIAIKTVLTDLINQPGYVPSKVAAGDVGGFLDAHMQKLHVFGKEVFGSTINDEMSKRIALID